MLVVSPSVEEDVRILFLFLVLIVPPTFSTAYGQEKGGPERGVLEFFIGSCLAPFPDLNKIRATARVLRWKPVQGDVATMLGPADTTAKYELWAVAEPADVLMVGISEGRVGTRKASACVNALRSVDQDRLALLIEQRTSVGRVSDTTENFQRHRTWTITYGGLRFLMELGALADTAASPATLSVMYLE